MLFLYATDLHGNQNAIEQIFDLASREQVDAIIFGGDLTPKSVAIKLARYPDPLRDYESISKEVPFLGGEVIPINMLKEDLESYTFSESLYSIKILNERVGSEVLAKHLERKGSIIYEPAQFYDFESMFMEQKLLDKLFVFFRYASRLNGRARLQLSKEELEMLRDCVVDWLKQDEETWSEEKHEEFILKCSQRLGGFDSMKGDFSDWKPSRYFEDYILLAISDDELLGIVQDLESLLRKYKSPIAKHLFKAFHDRFFMTVAYKGLIEEAHIAALVRYSTIVELKCKAEDVIQVKQGQAKFLQEYFLPLVQQWRAANGNKPIYVMLGNDDIMENISLLDEAERHGLLYHIHNKIHELGDDLIIAGYSFVETLPQKVDYREWVKADTEILYDLRSLQSQVRQKQVIWAIHHPPYGYLDQDENGIMGSKGVLGFLTESQPRLALFGHIHEAPRLTGAYITQLGKTLCVNPGGEHEEGLQAVVINTETLEIKKVKGGKRDDGNASSLRA